MKIEIHDLDGSGFRCAVLRNGLVTYVGPAEQCQRRAAILARREDRAQQDRMLVRAVR